ncbi:MAG: glycosyltransferase family 4 protein [bacterium]|nr:glycosyltransferase family 4 protein [bacterium]
MKILMLTPYLPYPPSAGGQIRSYNLIKHLSQRHEITLACFTRDTNTPDQVAHMEKFCKKVLVFKRGKAWTIPNILRTGFSVYPFLVMIYYTPEIRPRLEEEIKTGHYDLIHAETSYVMPYLPKSDVPTVLVEQTIMSRVFAHQIETDKRWWLRPLLLIDVAKIAYWEKYFWKRADRLAAVSAEDAAIIKKVVPNKDVAVIPNGVGDDFDRTFDQLHYNPTIFYMGNYKWMQNWEAAEILATKVFPLIANKIPDIQLNLVGQFPTPSLRAMVKHNPNIHIVELDDSDREGVVKTYQNSGLLVAPIYGPSGTRLKILAAMASMTPVVTTPIGAEGLGIKDGQSMMIGATPEQLAAKTVQILSDKKLYQKIAINAKKIADVGFTWEPISKKLETIYNSVV